MSRFIRQIYQTNSICVKAVILDTDKREIVSDGTFNNPFASQVSRFKAAHKWADKQIENLQRYTTDKEGRDIVEERMKRVLEEFKL